MNHAARHLCINSAQYTLANTNIRINNKLDTQKHTHVGIIYLCCVLTKNGGLKMNYKENETLENSRHHTYFWTLNGSDLAYCDPAEKNIWYRSIRGRLYGCNRVESLWGEHESRWATRGHFQNKKGAECWHGSAWVGFMTQSTDTLIKVLHWPQCSPSNKKNDVINWVFEKPTSPCPAVT